MVEDNGFTPPTYEEYIKATQFARIRYKYGLIVTIITAILFILLIFFVIRYGEELSRHPFIYGADKYDVECNCYGKDYSFFVNSTTLDSSLNKKSGFSLDEWRSSENPQ